MIIYGIYKFYNFFFKAGPSISSNSTGNANTASNAENQLKRQQILQQQQNMAAQSNLSEKLKNTLGLLSIGFNKLNSSSGGFNLVRNAASGLVSSNSSQSPTQISMNNHHQNQANNLDSSLNDSSSNHLQQSPSSNSSANVNSTNANSSSVVASSSANQINREVRIGVTYAYVELANLLGSNWLERNLKLLLNSVLSLVNGTKSVATHLDAVYSRKCVQFIMRSIIGGMLNEKMQLEAARMLLNIVDKCTKGVEFDEQRKPTATNLGALNYLFIGHINK